MKKAFKYIALTLAIILGISVVAVFFIWGSINKNTILKILESKSENLKKNGISITIEGLELKKDFPTLKIYVKKASILSQQVKATAYGSIIKIPILKVVVAKILSRPYIGNIKISAANVIIKSGEHNKFNPENIKIPLIPVNIQLKQITLRYANLVLLGKTKANFNPLTNNSNISFKGTINGIPAHMKVKLSKPELSIKAYLDKIAYKKLKTDLQNINLEVTYVHNKHLHLTARIKNANIYGIKLKFTSIKLNITTKEYPTLILKNLVLSSKNGYSIKLTGRIDTNNPKISTFNGVVSTGYINLKHIRLPQSIQGYLTSGEIKLANLMLNGKPTLKSVKSGTILVKNVKFRIDKKTSLFHIDQGVAHISPKKVVLEGSGSFDQMYSPKSTLIIYRKKGYPTDMHIYFYGKATELVRVFLERDILSNGDIRLLGTTSDLKGKVKARIDILYYKWGPQPYFNFIMHIDSNGASLKNSNIPNEYIKTFGNITIERVVENKKIKLLYINFSNFKAITKTSIFTTRHLKLTIKPTVKFNGNFNINISDADLKELAKNAFKKTIPFKLKRVKATGTINGTLKNLKASSKIAIIPQAPLKITAKLSYQLSYPILKVYNLTVNGIGNLIFSGKANIQNGNILNAKIKAKNLKINSLRSLITLNKNISGLLNGNINFSMNNKVPVFKNGRIMVDNATVGPLKNIKAILNFSNSTIKASDISFKFLGNRFYANTIYNIATQHVKAEIKANKTLIDLKKVVPKGRFKGFKYSFNLPKYTIDANIYIKSLSLKNKGMQKSFGYTIINVLNTKDFLRIALESKTEANITYYKPSKKIYIHLEDRVVWPLITKCKDKRNLLKIRGNIFLKKRNTINIKTLSGHMKFTAKHGYFSKAPSVVNVLALLNPFEMLIRGVEPSTIEYSKIYANIRVKDGTLITSDKDPAFLKGNIYIFGYGKFNVIKKKIDAYVTFVTLSGLNKIISKIPIIGWIIGGKTESFTGLSFHIKGDISHPSVKPIPFKSLAKGIGGIIKRTIMTPFRMFGVK